MSTTEQKFDYKKELLNLVPNVDIVNDYLKVRKANKGVETKTGLNTFKNECDRHNISYEKAMIIVISKCWRGFEYNWLKDDDFIRFGIKKQTIQQPKKEIPITMAEIKNTLSNEEKILNDKKVINQCFLEYIDEMKPINLPSIKFDSLVEYGMIKLPSDENSKLAIYYSNKKSEAIKFLKNKYLIEKATSLNEKRTLTQINEMLEAGKYPEIVTKTKELVVIDFFDKMIKYGKTKIFDI